MRAKGGGADVRDPVSHMHVQREHAHTNTQVCMFARVERDGESGRRVCSAPFRSVSLPQRVIIVIMPGRDDCRSVWAPRCARSLWRARAREREKFSGNLPPLFFIRLRCLHSFAFPLPPSTPSSAFPPRAYSVCAAFIPLCV